MKPLTDEQRKRLTLYLGECWHEDDSSIYHPNRCTCGYEVGWRDDFELHISVPSRTFATYEDLGKLKDRLVENGEWDSFSFYAFDVWFDKGTHQYDKDIRKELFPWLFRPESCGLVAEYLEQKEGK
jgi:hypothetical protein